MPVQPFEARLQRTGELLCSSSLPAEQMELATCMPDRVTNLHKNDVISISAAFSAIDPSPYILRYHIGHMKGVVVPFTRWRG